MWRFALALFMLTAPAWGQTFYPGPGAGVPSSSGSPAAQGAYANPRDYGATCATGTFNVNDATHDDGPGIRAAAATGLPVLIPWPGCKAVTQIPAPGAGATFFSFGGAGPYDSLGSANTLPYIFVPDAASSNATNNCIFDTKGYDGVTFKYLNIIGNSQFNGTVAYCNSVGIADSRPQAFAHFDHVSVSRMGNAVGGAMDSNCAPTGTLANPVFQFTFVQFNIGHTCFGMYGNFSDVHGFSFYGANIWHSCLVTPGASGVSVEIIGGRCEYTGHFGAEAVLFDGAGVYFAGLGMNHLTNWTFDHTFGSCITLDGADASRAPQTSLVQIQCKDAVTGGAVSEGGVITNPCNWVIANQVGYAAAEAVQAESFTTLVKYNLCFRGTKSYEVTWHQMGGDSGGGGGWRTANVNGTRPDYFELALPANERTTSDALSPITLSAPSITLVLPTSCSGQPAGSLWNDTAVLKICP